MNGWLRGKRKGVNPVMAQIPHIVRNAVRITGKDVVKQLGCRKKITVVGRVFLIPEDCRNSVSLAPLKEADKLYARAGGTRELTVPGSGISVPGRFHEQEIDPGLPQLITPQLAAQFEQVPFERKGGTREIVKNHAHVQIRAPPSQSGRFVGRELQLPVSSSVRPFALWNLGGLRDRDARFRILTPSPLLELSHATGSQMPHGLSHAADDARQSPAPESLVLRRLCGRIRYDVAFCTHCPVLLNVRAAVQRGGGEGHCVTAAQRSLGLIRQKEVGHGLYLHRR
ncbi:hypothetical protein ACQCSU_04095 [Pseudarthrobacter sp. O4]|uniref:hypothetical protein n=1 Tax=Pseudarthrobacter sp. O4 TaxID=3418417 RepID=UPI003CEB1B1A